MYSLPSYYTCPLSLAVLYTTRSPIRCTYTTQSIQECAAFWTEHTVHRRSTESVSWIQKPLRTLTHCAQEPPPRVRVPHLALFAVQYAQSHTLHVRCTRGLHTQMCVRGQS